ncbi:hypothetical protein ARMSODRAFT_1022761 [Armillaria solidipes]|uniref:Uncharacterized protein n=1 Tax=Armillaria solidipes TaxID=1076256 RepID=A0A2H3BLM8_9AGAR|nr:hypothetical protein ARMSODRAFT_1022761 [Armillaria solidipes]
MSVILMRLVDFNFAELSPPSTPFARTSTLVSPLPQQSVACTSCLDKYLPPRAPSTSEISCRTCTKTTLPVQASEMQGLGSRMIRDPCSNVQLRSRFSCQRSSTTRSPIPYMDFFSGYIFPSYNDAYLQPRVRSAGSISGDVSHSFHLPYAILFPNIASHTYFRNISPRQCYFLYPAADIVLSRNAELRADTMYDQDLRNDEAGMSEVFGVLVARQYGEHFDVVVARRPFSEVS